MDSSLFVLASNHLIDTVVWLGGNGFIRGLAAFAATYWLHSTVLLGAA